MRRICAPQPKAVAERATLSAATFSSRLAFAFLSNPGVEFSPVDHDALMLAARDQVHAIVGLHGKYQSFALDPDQFRRGLYSLSYKIVSTFLDRPIDKAKSSRE